MENERKPFLSIDDQVTHLKSKGVTFNLVTEEEAEDYLQNNNNLFKLSSYRKIYEVLFRDGAEDIS